MMDIYTFANVTCKGVTFRLAKGSHLDSRAHFDKDGTIKAVKGYH